MKFKKIISLFSAVTMLSTAMAIAPVAYAAEIPTLKVTSRELTADDMNLARVPANYKGYVVSYKLNGVDEEWTFSENDWQYVTTSGLMSATIAFDEVAESNEIVNARTFNTSKSNNANAQQGYLYDSRKIPIDDTFGRTGFNFSGANPVSLFAAPTVEDDAAEGVKFTYTGEEATLIDTVWYIKDGSSYTINYDLDSMTMLVGSSDSFVKYWGNPKSATDKKFVMTVNGVEADTLTLGAAPTVKLSKVEITSTATEVVDGQTLTLTAKAVNDDNSENKTATLAWTSSKEDVATVEGGVVTAKKPGTTTISVTATDGTDTATATVDITVTKAPAILNSLNVTGADTVVEGETITLGYDAKDQYGDEFTATKTEWTSSKEEIATVDENGVVTGVAAGTAKITLKVNDSVTAFKNVTVTAKPVVNPVITINGATGFVDGVAVTAGTEKGFVWTPVVISNYNSKAGTYTATFKAEGTPDKTAVLKGLPAIEGNPTVTFAVILRTIKTGVKLGIDFAE